MPTVKVLRNAELVSYDKDVLLWSEQQAQLLQEGRFAELDIEHLADEILDVGKSEKRELASRVAVLLAHLIKWKLQKERRSSSWEATIRDQRKRIIILLEETPSLKARCLGDVRWVEAAWLDARVMARREMRIRKESSEIAFAPVWDRAIWSMDAILNPVFWPD